MVCFETNRKLAHTMVMKSAGTSVMMYGFFFVAIYTVSVHSVITESVWFDHPKYCHITLKPLGLSICHTSMAMADANRGPQMSRRLCSDFCSTCRASEIIRRAERNAVSPLVIGAATTPIKAKMPPTMPNHSLQMMSTTLGADVWKPSACNSS